MSELAVVPIFVNAGAAVLPAILGGLVSGVALLFKPKELLRVFRRKPWLPFVIVGIGALLWLGVVWVEAAANSPSKTETAAPAFDWGDVGRQILVARKMAAMPATSASRPATQAVAAEVGLGRDASRCSFDGGRSPLGLEEAWSYRDGDVIFLSSPTVANGKVFGASCQLDIVGKFGYVFAADAQTGKILWKTEGPSANGAPFKAFFSSPALTKDGKSLVIGQGLHDSADCSLLCLDAMTGALKWQAPTPLHLESSPAIHGDIAVVGAGAIEDSNHKATGDPGFVMAVQISTGNVLWRHPVNDPESSPAIDDNGVVYIGSGFNGNAVVALRSETDAELAAKGLKREIWKTSVAYPVTSDVTIADDLIITGSGNCDYVNVDPRPAGGVIALDRKTGAIRWKYDAADSVLGFVAFRDGRLVCPVRSGHVVMLDAKTGQLKWRVRVGGGTPILAGCAFTGTHVYTVAKDGWLSVLDAKSGKTIERVFANQKGKPGENGFCISSPTVVDGRVYVGSETGGLRCFAGTK